MSDDLKARLREIAASNINGWGYAVQAIDRIEQLEAENAALSAWQCTFTDGRTGIVCDEYGHQFCQQALALTKSRAETAAAYERAAQEAHKNTPAPAGGPFSHTNTARVTAIDIENEIRALATPDQSAALERLIAEAEARVWKEAEKLVRPTRGKSGNGIVVAALHRVADAILEASKKGGA